MTVRSVRLGYTASAEQFGPRRCLDFSVQAGELGFDTVAVSDHFQPAAELAGRVGGG